MIKLALLAPTSMLDAYASKSDGIHMVLAHMVLKDPVYTAWYRARSDAGDFLILDNGAYEFNDPLPTPQLVEAAKRVGASTVVAPDYPGQHFRRTTDAFFQFRDDLPEPFKIVGIPQGNMGDIVGWQRCFETFLADPARLSHIGMSILACPNAFRNATKTVDIELNRFVATAHAREYIVDEEGLRRLELKLHYFGLGTRLDLLPSYDGYADSLDTKGPVKAGVNYLGDAGSRLYRGSSAKMDLSMPALPAGDTRHDAILENIARLKAALGGKNA